MIKINALDENGNEITVKSFFEREKEFSNDPKLIEQTNRFLKVIIRNLDNIDDVFDHFGNDYVFSVSGKRIFKIYFKVDFLSDTITLSNII